MICTTSSLDAQRLCWYIDCPCGRLELAVYVKLATGKQCCPVLVSLKVERYALAGSIV